MDDTVTISISIEKSQFNQAETLAEQLDITPDALFKQAVEKFIAAKTAPEADKTVQRIINQGDIYWMQLDNPGGSDSDIAHPHVILQENVFNHSRIPTVIACALTTNLKRASLPGNILLDEGEGHLPRQSVVEVSKVSTVDKARLGDYIGALDGQRVTQILAGLRFLQTSYFDR